jgi:hypothetical protein
VKKGLVNRQEDWRWSSYNNFALDKATVAACPIQIDYVRLPLGYRAGEKPTVRKTLTATRLPYPALRRGNAERGDGKPSPNCERACGHWCPPPSLSRWHFDCRYWVSFKFSRNRSRPAAPLPPLSQ